MPRTPNVFTNPRTGAQYAWEVNHNEEEPLEFTHAYEHSAPTAATGLNRQQGDPAPPVLRLSGTILRRTQLDMMFAWFELGRAQTIYYTSFAGEQWEVLITSFKPKVVRALDVPRGRQAGTNPQWYWTYVLEMEVVRSISGPAAGVTV